MNVAGQQRHPRRFPIGVGYKGPDMVTLTDRQRRLWMGEKEIAEFRLRQCINRTLLAEDVARLALFLSSDDSAMITKQCYQVDGGLR